MDVRAAHTDETPSIEAIVAAAFGPSRGGTVVELVRALSASNATRASLVAADGNDLTGHVQLSRGWVDARSELVEVLVLSPLSVTPRRQRNGVGTRLVAAALAEAERLGAPAVFLEGAWSYYGPRGFVPGNEHGFVRPSARIPQRAFQVAFLSAFEPWMIGQLIYPEAFWTHDSVGLRDPRLAQLEQS